MRLKQKIKDMVMGSLLCAAILLSGAEFEGFPWGALLGSICWIILFIVTYEARRRRREK